MFCCTLLYVHSSIAIILMGKRELVALLNLSSWCLVMVERLFLAVLWGCLRFVIVVFPDHTHLLLSLGLKELYCINTYSYSCFYQLPKRMKIHVQIRRFTCCLNIGLNMKILKISPSYLHDAAQKKLRTKLIISLMLLFTYMLRTGMIL